MGEWVRPFTEVLREYIDYLDDLRTNRRQAAGIPTGFQALDKLLEGFQPSDMIIVAGRPGMGKTGFLLTIARHVGGTLHKHVAIFSLEMPNEQLVQRLLAQEAKVNSQDLRTGKLSDAQWQRVNEAADKLSNATIFLDDTPAITPTQLRSKCRRLHMEYGLDLVMIDYLQLMTSGTRTENRVQEVSYISRSLKGLARELNVPVVAAAQLSRAVEQRTKKRPMLSDLRESGSLEQDADVVMFLYRDKIYNKETERQDVAEVIVAKHRNGPIGDIELIFKEDYAQFTNAVLQPVNTAQP